MDCVTKFSRVIGARKCSLASSSKNDVLKDIMAVFDDASLVGGWGRGGGGATTYESDGKACHLV